MRRIVVMVAVVGLLLGHAGCDGGPEVGVPAGVDASKQPDMTDKFDKMKGIMKNKKAPKSSGPIKG